MAHFWEEKYPHTFFKVVGTRELERIKEINMALIAGRYEIPQATDGYVFREKDIDVVMRKSENIRQLDALAEVSIFRAAKKCGYIECIGTNEDDEFVYDVSSDTEIHLYVMYVTGFTPALVAVINVCHRMRRRLILHHFNPKTGEYYLQNVVM